MSKKDDGGPAFPSGLDQDADYSRIFQHPMHAGISMRDYFAAAALQGLSSASDSEGVWTASPEETAENAYAFADAMLAERAK